MNRVIIDSFTDEKGRFLFWKWELWSVGGGGGVSWFFLNRSISPGQYNPLWLIFSIQRKLRRSK